MIENFKFKKQFGQNFIKDDNIVKKIAESAPITKDDLVIEIGPGSGMLTKHIASLAKNVLCYEIDTRLEDILANNLKKFDNVKIIFDDCLNRDISEDIKEFDYKKIYFVANLPYYITTPIINKLISSGVDIEEIVIMVQKEVGERFSAKVGTKDYSSITVYLNYFYQIKKLFLVSRNSFVPKPNVDSVVIGLIKKENRLELKNKELFFKIVRDSFQYKRKNIRNNLKQYDLNKIEAVLKDHGFDLNARAEQLEIEIFKDIANRLS